jgi:hypothetical protein
MDPGDFLLLDEAQDIDPALEQVFPDQGKHAGVGNSVQAIYGWRVARHVITGFGGRQLALSRFFRFGPGDRRRSQPVTEAPLSQLTAHCEPVRGSSAVRARLPGRLQ